MPIYDYQCQACNYTFESMHSIHDDPIKKCPQCKRLKVKRLISVGAGVILKGSGFYSVDHGTNRKSNTPEVAHKTASSTSQTTDTSTSTSSTPKTTESNNVNTNKTERVS